MPPGCEAVVRDGQAFVGLVGLNFSNTVVGGVGWPGYRRFPEVNLRFYVRRGEDHGVVFVRELVPLRLVAALAKWAYNEPSRRVPMRSRVERAVAAICVGYAFTFRVRPYDLGVTAYAAEHVPASDKDDFCFTDQHWGFGTTRRGRLLSNRVDHPLWAVHRVRSFTLDLDWEHLYGPRWTFLQSQQPQSVTFAAGSRVTVSPWATPG